MADYADIKKLESELERLQKLVYYDDLTGLLNRRGFKEEADKAFRAVSYGRTTIERRIGFEIPFSIIFLDIDDFKKINDTHGHEVGDKTLKKITDVLCKYLRTSDIIGRWGGEEFVIALLGANLDTSRIVADKLREEISSAKVLVKKDKISVTASFGVTASIGVKMYDKEKTLSELIQKADHAMYQAKHAGKNRVVISD